MQKGGGPSVDEAVDVGIDATGNTYTVGYFSGNASFGSNSISSNGGTDVFLTKTNSLGVVMWAASGGGAGADRGLSVAVDDAGNAYITGYFNGTATFGASTITSSGQQDVFIAKYNTSGVLQWVVKAGGSNTDIGNGIALDASGNAYVTGEFKGTASFGGTNLTSVANSADVFTTKVSSNGSFVWTEHGSGSGTNRGIDVGCDGSGNVYITGEFSSSITFDNAHANTMLNVVFVLKYNSSGVEQWFRVIGAGNSNIPTALAVDGSSNVFVTGEFTGTITIFNSSNTMLSGNYSNSVFVVKYNSSGATQWSVASSSDALLTSKDVAVDGIGNAYITGSFECTHADYSDVYGEGTFNNIGFTDVYVTKFTAVGAFDYSRQYGGREEDYGRGIIIDSVNQPVVVGSFKTDFSVPTSSNFLAANLNQWSLVGCGSNNGYCGDNSYGQFHSMSATGNSDAFVINAFDPSREPYDYYLRTGSGCVRDQNDICLGVNCPDTISGCQGVSVNGLSNMCESIGPGLMWKYPNLGWSSNNFGGFLVSPPSYRELRIKTDDNCYQFVDSVYADIKPSPSAARFTDSEGINIQAQTPAVVEVCDVDTVYLTGSGFGTNQFSWGGSSPYIGTSQDTTIAVTATGTYSITITDTISGCSSFNQIQVVFAPNVLPPMHLAVLVDDTVEACQGDLVEIWLYDSLAFPNGNTQCMAFPGITLTTLASVNPATIVQSIICETAIWLYPVDTGWVSGNVSMIRTSACDTDTTIVSYNFYYQPYPSPQLAPINISINENPPYFFCPADSILITAYGAPNYVWNGPISGSVENDSIYISQAGLYTVYSSLSDTNLYGCVGNTNSQKSIYVQEKPQPEISVANNLICPNDSILISCNVTTNPFNSGLYQWFGPNGSMASTGNSVWASESGDYFVVINDADSCDLTSNTITMTEYTTPQLIANGDLFICEGDSVQISVISTVGSQIEWQSPLSGAGGSKFVYEPGIYTCKITSCGIETFASMEVLPGPVDATISGDTFMCFDDTITLSAVEHMMVYQWSGGTPSVDSLLVTEPGTYTLTATDSAGCVKVSDPFKVVSYQDTARISLHGEPVLCEGDTMHLSGTPNQRQYLWKPTMDTVQTISINNDGLYTLFIVDSNGCTDLSESLTISTPDTLIKTEMVGDSAFCEGDSVTLNLLRTRGLASYIWRPGNFEGKQYTVHESGTYRLATTDTFGCAGWSVPYVVSMQPNQILEPVGLDTVICAGTIANLNVSTNLGDIEWRELSTRDYVNDGESFITPPLFTSTIYLLKSTFGLCESDTNTITVTVINCDSIFIPNIFTPNGDGYNDVFRVALHEITCLHVTIYNRWGRVVGTIEEPDGFWDGTLRATGKEVPEGVYFYLADYCKFNGLRETARGDLTLIRD